MTAELCIEKHPESMKEVKVFSIHIIPDPLGKHAGARGLPLLTEGDLRHRLKPVFRDHGS